MRSGYGWGEGGRGVVDGGGDWRVRGEGGLEVVDYFEESFEGGSRMVLVIGMAEVPCSCVLRRITAAAQTPVRGNPQRFLMAFTVDWDGVFGWVEKVFINYPLEGVRVVCIP